MFLLIRIYHVFVWSYDREQTRLQQILEEFESDQEVILDQTDNEESGRETKDIEQDISDAEDTLCNPTRYSHISKDNIPVGVNFWNVSKEVELGKEML